MGNEPRTLLISDKGWEADAVGAVLASSKARPDTLSVVSTNVAPGFRAKISATAATIELWCIQDIMDPHASQSSTAEKWGVLPQMFQHSPMRPALVVSLATASFDDVVSHNGCVVVGTRAFVHNVYADDPNPASTWSNEECDVILRSSAAEAEDGSKSLFQRLLKDPVKANINSRLIPTPISAAEGPFILSAANYTAVSNVNITNYDDYVWADPLAIAAFEDANTRSAFGSLETTHGVIRLASDAPFIFISGIANRFGRFNEEAGVRDYAQNFVAAHNAGIAAVWLLSQF